MGGPGLRISQAGMHSIPLEDYIPQLFLSGAGIVVCLGLGCVLNSKMKCLNMRNKVLQLSFAAGEGNKAEIKRLLKIGALINEVSRYTVRLFKFSPCSTDSFIIFDRIKLH